MEILWRLLTDFVLLQLKVIIFATGAHSFPFSGFAFSVAMHTWSIPVLAWQCRTESKLMINGSKKLMNGSQFWAEGTQYEIFLFPPVANTTSMICLRIESVQMTSYVLSMRAPCITVVRDQVFHVVSDVSLQFELCPVYCSIIICSRSWNHQHSKSGLLI